MKAIFRGMMFSVLAGLAMSAHAVDDYIRFMQADSGTISAVLEGLAEPCFGSVVFPMDVSSVGRNGNEYDITSLFAVLDPKGCPSPPQPYEVIAPLGTVADGEYTVVWISGPLNVCGTFRVSAGVLQTAGAPSGAEATSTTAACVPVTSAWVQKAFVAYYGRPADPAGLAYWANRMDSEGGSLNVIIGAFGNSDEFKRRYGGLAYTQLVTKIYQQAIGRDPDQGGLDWYVAQLVAGGRSLQTITLDVLNGAITAPDSTVVANKLTVAAYYTARVAAGCPYGTEQHGVDVITIVTALPASVAAAEAAVDAGCEP